MRILGSKDIEIRGFQYRYSGELDSDGKATGYGTAVGVVNPGYRYRGTFLDD